MSQPAQQTIPKEKFLVLAVNLLHRYFIAGGRAQAKRLYREIREGKLVPLTSVKMEDDSTVRFSLSLDHSEFGGHLNFGAFRGGLSVLLGNLARALQDRQDITVFSVEQRQESVLFGITGVTVDGDRTSVMVLGADTQGQAGFVTLRLMYLDPAQFARKGDDAVPDSAVS
ncbi:MAG: hypothetical protein V2I26_14345 [Halieaceae bacterium]|jgi:hypothetical protein|nr:hypothetical protein [Halieaceae bacterium]